ncbi:TPA: restriction endonuclease subunit S [Vibrio parahaemolyticus]|nr:restriction endonuclease subunit S [Vibrio parahaemolyticus]HCG8455021.1 restriction endonuclease subunit S [Vibrio parahaemolyticus]
MSAKHQLTEYGYLSSRLLCSKLSDLCVDKVGVQTGPFGSQLHKEDYVDIGTPIITVEHLGNNRISHIDTPFVTDEDKKRLSKYQLKSGDIVFSRVGSVDRRALVRKEEDGWLFSGRCLRVRVDKTKIDPVYLSYFFGLESFKKYIRSIAVGATMPSINTKILSDIPIYYPECLEEQKRIAHIFITNDEKVNINNQTNQTLEEMAQAIFKSWFVDFDPVKAKMNGEQPEGMDAATASLFPDKLVESELGLIPEGWSASKLEDLVDIASSKRVFAKEYLDEGVPFYRGKEITELSKGNSVTPEIYISEERYQELKDKAGAPKENDILITSVGTIGNTYLVDSEDKFYFKDGNLTWVKDYKEEIIPYFLMEWFKSSVGKSAIENIKIGSTQQAITIKSLNGIKLVSPSYAVHEKFTQIVEPLYKKHRANIKQNKALSTLRDTLLPKLLSGEIELDVAEVNTND